MALDVRLYVALVISCDISSYILCVTRQFYYKLDGEKKTEHIMVLRNRSIRRAVLGIDRWLIIRTIEVKTIDDSKETNIYVRHFDGLNVQKHKCDFDEEEGEFKCEMMARYVVIESKSEMEKVSPVTRDVSAERYIGCFKNLSTLEEAQTAVGVVMCYSLCETFYAVNSSLKEFVQVHLNQCTHYFQEFELCGNDSYLAIYWKDKETIGFSNSSWDCIYELKNCPICPKGKMGADCEINDCSDNGNCGDSKCQNITPWKFFTFINCFCTSGFHAGPTQCEDIDECANSSNLCDANTTKCVNNVGSYMCECAPGFKKLNQFECEEKEQEREQDKEQEKEIDQEKDPKAGQSLVYTGAGFAVIALLCIIILYIYFKKKSAKKA